MSDKLIILLIVMLDAVFSHGQMNHPISNPIKSSTQWFSDGVKIPGKITLPEKFKTLKDVVPESPWNAPGTAPIFGSGCGISGGGWQYKQARGPPVSPIYPYGYDGLQVPITTSVKQNAGSVIDVMWTIAANHGGGYSQRMCKNDGKSMPDEECFLNNTLKYSSDKSWIAQDNGTKVAFDNPILSEGTQPKGSHWKRNPVPGCYGICTPTEYTECQKHPLDTIFECVAKCVGLRYKDGLQCPEGKTQFSEPLPGISGAGPGLAGKKFNQSILDKVILPNDLEPGKYILSWRWDCEQTTQVWQNCVDLLIDEGKKDSI